MAIYVQENVIIVCLYIKRKIIVKVNIEENCNNIIKLERTRKLVVVEFNQAKACGENQHE